MKKLTVVALAACSLSFAGPSLTSMKKGIENDIGKISGDLDSIVKRCTDLKADVDEFNARTAAASEEIAAKRAERSVLVEKYYYTIQVFDAAQSSYQSIQGTIEATTLSLELVRARNLEALKEKLSLTTVELKTASAALKAAEKTLLDPAAYATDEDRRKAEIRAMELRARVNFLVSRKLAIEETMSTPDPQEATLLAKLALLQDKANYHADVIKWANQNINAVGAAITKISSDLAKAESKAGSFKQFELPKICGLLL